MIGSADWLMQAAMRANLMLAGVFVLWRFLPAARPALRRYILLGIATGLLVAPWLGGWWSLDAPLPRAVASASPQSVPAFPLARIVTSLWLAGSGLALLRLGWQSLALHQVIRRARPWAGSPALTNLKVMQSSAISGPCVAGSHRPVLLLPESAHAWTPPQWDMVLAHETQHLQQHDLRLSWLPRLVRCLYWWHPLAYWLNRQFLAESEALCDHAVVTQSGRSPREYVEFLLSLNAAHLPTHAAGMALKSPLGKRLTRLLVSPPRSPRYAMFSSLTLLAGITGLALCLRTLPEPPILEPHAGQPPSIDAIPTDEAAAEASLRLAADAFPQN